MADGDRKKREASRNPPVNFDPAEDVGLRFFLKSAGQRDKLGRAVQNLLITNESNELVRGNARRA
jgi:hypothetical protein